MDTYLNLNSPLPHRASTLTIGNFDGVHRGHQAVLAKLCETARQDKGSSAVFTFKNHPSQVLRPHQACQHLCTPDHKIDLIAESGVDILFLMPFTLEFSRQSAEAFLSDVRRVYPFKHLILGHDATFGKDREGNRDTLTKLAQQNGFTTEYLDEMQDNGLPISSSRIRQLLSHGALKEAGHLLGRPYSIKSVVLEGYLDVAGLCLPPQGTYSVKSMIDGKEHKGVAYLEKHEHNEPRLKIDFHQDLQGRTIEVIFNS